MFINKLYKNDFFYLFDNRNKMKTLIIDCDGVLYPESQFPLSIVIKAIEKLAASKSISREEYNKISQETIDRGEQGLFNFILNLCHKNRDLYNSFCKELVDSLDYSSIKRNDELFNLLLKASKKYEICILTNDCIFHLDRIYKQLFGKSLQEFPFPSYDITSTFQDGCFHPKQAKEGYVNFMKKINKDKKDCIVIDDSYANIKRCMEIGIQYEYITESNTLNDVLEKLIKI